MCLCVRTLAPSPLVLPHSLTHSRSRHVLMQEPTTACDPLLCPPFPFPRTLSCSSRCFVRETSAKSCLWLNSRPPVLLLHQGIRREREKRMETKNAIITRKSSCFALRLSFLASSLPSSLLSPPLLSLSHLFLSVMPLLQYSCARTERVSVSV